jgi:hypothetical protein
MENLPIWGGAMEKKSANLQTYKAHNSSLPPLIESDLRGKSTRHFARCSSVSHPTFAWFGEH